MRLVQLRHQWHDFGFVQFVLDRHWLLGGRRHTIAQSVIESESIAATVKPLRARRPRMRRASVVLPAPPFVAQW
jgi:hypothetical protein